MHRLVINELGPIERCELECAPFITLTGFQASGKSTVAKAVYYFRTIKEDIEELAKKQAFSVIPENGMEDEYDVGHGLELNTISLNPVRRQVPLKALTDTGELLLLLRQSSVGMKNFLLRFTKKAVLRMYDKIHFQDSPCLWGFRIIFSPYFRNAFS